MMDNQGISISATATRAGEELRESGILISHRQLMRKLEEANLTGESQPPEKPGGVFMPFFILVGKTHSSGDSRVAKEENASS
jgi:hypothetical protein